MAKTKWPLKPSSIVVVFGGTGAFGKTFVKDLIGSGDDFQELRVVSRDEHKHLHLKEEVTDPRLNCIVGDVRNPDRVFDAVGGADLVIQAAALKHVHFTERHPMEAVYTNTVGAYNIVRACIQNNVERAITISTDKAVESANAMGMTKALSERIWSSYAGRGTKLSIIRYGNVLYSTGSIVPFFVQWLKDEKGPLPVTHPEMTRFLLTLEDSVDLVRLACWEANRGEVYVRESPAADILQIARVVTKETLGHLPDDYWKEIGIRPGEKLHETLVSTEEMRRCTRHEFGNEGWHYKKVLPYVSEADKLTFSNEEAYRSDNCRKATDDELQELIKRASRWEP
jgi:UDP-glucose 4-epimerase